LSGFAQINADNTFSTSVTSRPPPTVRAPPPPTSGLGHLDADREPDAVHFHSDRSVSTGVLNGNEITVIEDTNISFVFRK
jgi:hypothetical protein